MRDYISYTCDDQSGRWKSVLCYEPDPSDGKRKWCLRATRDIYSGEEITWSYGWDYWLHHSRGELQLFAWKCYANDQDVQAMSEDEYTLFSVMSPILPMVSASGASELLVIYTLARRSLGHMIGTTGSTIVGASSNCLPGSAMLMIRMYKPCRKMSMICSPG